MERATRNNLAYGELCVASYFWAATIILLGGHNPSFGGCRSETRATYLAVRVTAGAALTGGCQDDKGGWL